MPSKLGLHWIRTHPDGRDMCYNTGVVNRKSGRSGAGNTLRPEQVLEGELTMSKYTPRPAILKSCAVCKTEFSAKNANYKYCCAACREVAFKAKEPEYQKKYTSKNADAIRERRRANRLANLEEHRASQRKWMRQWREANGESSRAQAKDYYARNAEERRAYQRKYREENGYRVAAQWAVNDAVRAGRLPHAKSLTCVRCGGQATEYHHWSYEQDNWLKVEAMCPTCHARADQERIAAEAQ